MYCGSGTGGRRCSICTEQTLRMHAPDGSTFLREMTSSCHLKTHDVVSKNIKNRQPSGWAQASSAEAERRCLQYFRIGSDDTCHICVLWRLWSNCRSRIGLFFSQVKTSSMRSVVPTAQSMNHFKRNRVSAHRVRATNSRYKNKCTWQNWDPTRPVDGPNPYPTLRWISSPEVLKTSLKNCYTFRVQRAMGPRWDTRTKCRKTELSCRNGMYGCLEIAVIAIGNSFHVARV